MPTDANIIGGENVYIPVKVNYTDPKSGQHKEEFVKAQFIARPKYKTTVTDTDDKLIPYETKEVIDETLPAGTIQVVTPGKVGKERTIFEQDVINGQKGLIDPATGQFTAGDQLFRKRTETIEEKQDRLVKVGTKPVEETVTIPRPVEVEVDPNMEPTAEPVVVEEGQDGVVTVKTTRDPQTGAVNITKATTTPARPKKVKVGTKTTGTVVDNDEIPFKYTVEFDPDFYKNYPDATENYKVVTPGQAGSNKKTWTIENSKVVGDPAVETVAPVNAVIKVGQKDYTGSFETVDKDLIPYETEYIVDNTLEPGKEVVENPGELGEKTTTTTHTIQNGQVIASTPGQSTQTKDPVKRVVRIGAKSSGSYQVTEPISFQVEVKKDPSLKKGEYKVETPGKPGSQTKTLTIENSQVTATSEPTINEQATNAVVLVGDQDFTGEVSHDVTEKVPFPVKIVEDPTLDKGTYHVDQEGVPGSKTTTYTQAIKNGVADGALTSTVKAESAPQEHIIRVGTKPLTGSTTVTTTNQKPFDVEIEYDNTKPAGTVEVVPNTGVPGEETKTTPVTAADGTVTPGTTTTTETKAPVNKKIIVGTQGYNGEFSHEYTNIVPFETEVEVDPSLAPNAVVEVQKGQLGETTTKVSQTITNGVPGEKVVSDPVQTKTPVNRKIKVGAKTEGVHTYTEELPFSYTVEYDPAIQAGKYEIVTPGAVGSRTTEWPITNSVVGQGKVTQEIPATNALIKVGNKDFTGQVTHTETVPVPNTVEIRYNPNVKAGETKVLEAGKPGSVDVTYSQAIKNGQADGDLVKTEANRVDPVNRVIEVGTQPVSGTETPIQQDVPVEVEYVYDNTKDKGFIEAGQVTPGTTQSKVVSKVVDGQVVNTVENVVTPAKQQIIVGTKDYTGNFEYKDTDVIPNHTQVTINPNLAPNEIKVVEAGNTGLKERTVSQSFTNGKLGEQVVGDYTTVKEPKDRVIEIGAKTTGSFKDTDTIPFEVEVKYDPTLKKGEWKYATVDGLEQRGVAGEKERTLTIENSQVTNISDFTTTKVPQKAVILVGNEDLTGNFTTVDKDPIPFEVEVKVDPSLAPGKEVVDQEGVPGEEETPTTHQIVNGQVTASMPGETKQTKAPVKKIVRLGAKTDGTYTHKDALPFEVEVRKAPDLKKGQTRVLQEGQPGEQTTTVTIENSQVVGSPSTTITKAPVKHIIEVGDQDFTGEVSHNVTETLPFKVEIQEDPNLPLFEIQEVQKGENGSKTTKYSQSIKNGAADGQLKTEEIARIEPKTHIIKVGTKAPENAETRVKEVPAEIEYVYDNTKDKGIVEKGAYTPGKVETKIKNIFNPQTGQIETTTEEVVTPAKQVIVVGAKDFTGDYKFSNTCPVPFPVEIRENPDLPAGTSKTVQAGVPGSKTTDYTQALKNGQAEGAPVSQDGAYTAPKAHIIEVGTKPVAGNTHESNKDVPVETIFEYDPNLNKGKVETVQVVPGHVTTKLVNKVVNGQVVTEEVPVVTPAKHIVKVGTKDFTGSFTTVDKNPVPFEVEYKLDPSLAPGTEVVDQEGVVGEEETPTTHTIVNGQVTESTPGQTTQTKAPVKKIVRIGAKTDGSYTHTEEIPFQVKVEVDPSLPKGEYKVETPGQVGQKTTTVTIENSQFVGSPNVVVTKEPVTEIIKLGGKDFTGQVSHTEHFETAFKVIVRRNENLKPGQVKTVQEGVKGSYDVTFTQKIKNGQADGPLQADRHNEVAALDHIIEVGPDCPICPVPGQPDQPGQDKPNTDKPNEDKPGDNTTPGGHTPEEGNPEKPQPGDPTPGSDQPENPSSSDKIPGNNTPDGQTSEEPQPGDKKPGQGTSDPDRPGGSSSNGRVPEKHPSDDNTPGNPTPGAEIPEENISKDKDSEGDSSTDKQPAGTVQSDQPVGEDPALDPASSASLSPASHKTSSTPSHQSVQVASVLPQTGAVASVTGVGLSLLLAGLGCLGLDRKKKK
ncbi:hypothetical protein CYJ30_07165 [Aerococcus loyolae]|uniref:G5 domain-containing protein n=1 Tax=Aerococcus loyolae TaxID=2976809 RepID=UPI000C75FEAF|nr:G5 domain-containing protein [Aerococcus loyolae]PKY83458.1 hypothetical protein CYJ30_07165 [Aerococcus loyolae]